MLPLTEISLPFSSGPYELDNSNCYEHIYLINVKEAQSQVRRERAFQELAG